MNSDKVPNKTLHRPEFRGRLTYFISPADPNLLCRGSIAIDDNGNLAGTWVEDERSRAVDLGRHDRFGAGWAAWIQDKEARRPGCASLADGVFDLPGDHRMNLAGLGLHGDVAAYEAAVVTNAGLPNPLFIQQQLDVSSWDESATGYVHRMHAKLWGTTSIERQPRAVTRPLQLTDKRPCLIEQLNRRSRRPLPVIEVSALHADDDGLGAGELQGHDLDRNVDLQAPVMEDGGLAISDELVVALDDRVHGDSGRPVLVQPHHAADSPIL